MANLLPVTIKKKITKHYKMRVLSLVLLIIACVAILAVTLLLPSVLMVQEKYSYHKKGAGTTEVEHEVYMNSQKVIEEAQEKMNVLKEQYVVQKVSTTIIDMIMKHKTDDIAINVFSYARISGGTTPIYARVSISGIAKDRKGLTNFERDLKDERLILKVSNPVEGLAEKENLSFSIIIEVAIDESLNHE